MTEQQDNKTLNLYPIDYPFETLVSRITSEKPKLILNPDFQRKYKWDKEGWGRASKFIESCLMRIPLPSCYFAEDEQGRHLVIDGVQRLTTIKKFFCDEFSLEGMTIFKNLEGKKFSEIGNYQSELEATTIRCIILRKENSKNLIREIFARLNQGAVKLSSQEIRHAIYPGCFDDLLVELSKIPLISDFSLTENSNRSKDDREAEEQVLRFFAFNDQNEKLDDYEGNLGTFLDAYMEKKSVLDEEEINRLRVLFTSALEKCKAVFGDTVFSDTTKQRSKQGLVYYDLLMPTVGVLEQIVIDSKTPNIQSAFRELCKSNAFRKTLSGGLQNKTSILRRRMQWRELLENAING